MKILIVKCSVSVSYYRVIALLWARSTCPRS